MRLATSRRATVALVALCALVATSCQLHLSAPTGAGPLRYRDQIFSQAEITKDITYGQAADLTGTMKILKLDMYQPKGDTVTERPAIVFVHGGGFKQGSKTSGELVDQATWFAQRGYLAVSISYRLGAGCTPFTDQCIDGINQAYHDAQAAVRFLRRYATTYRVDADRIAVAGSSAGGITAYNVAYGSESVGHSGNPGYSSKVQAAVSLSGAAIDTNPAKGDPPTMNFHGTADTLVPLSWNDSTVTAAKNKGLIAERTVWQGAGHTPYVTYRTQILEETRNFLYHALKAGTAEQ